MKAFGPIKSSLRLGCVVLKKRKNEINRKSKYMIICSDSIWEFISNEEAMEIDKKYYLRHDPLGLCNELTNKATEIWKVEQKEIN